MIKDDAPDDMEKAGFRALIFAPASIIGQPIQLLHWSGATEPVTFETVDEARGALDRGWLRYRPLPAPPASEGDAP